MAPQRNYSYLYFWAVCAMVWAPNLCGRPPDIVANPDFISTGFSWTSEGAPTARVGDVITWERLSLGGLLEAANEARYNQGFFPNHHWRGIALLDWRLFAISVPFYAISLHGGMKHESAHPTMGIREHSENAHEMVFDDTYRRMILNSFNAKAHTQSRIAGMIVSGEFAYHLFFLSKNTPELEGATLVTGNGFTLGTEFEKTFRDGISGFISLHDRIILRSGVSDANFVYRGNGAEMTKSSVEYSVMNASHTLVVKTGLVYDWIPARRSASLYGKWLLGNPYGFADSREKRRQWAFGFELFQLQKR